MLITQNLKILISSVSSYIYKQCEHAPVLCYSGESHIGQRTAKERRQKLGIHIAFEESESFTHLGGEGFFPTEGNAAALADGTSSLSHPFLQRQTDTEICI